MQACRRPERALHSGGGCLLRKAANVAAVLAALCTMPGGASLQGLAAACKDSGKVASRQCGTVHNTSCRAGRAATQVDHSTRVTGLLQAGERPTGTTPLAPCGIAASMHEKAVCSSI